MTYLPHTSSTSRHALTVSNGQDRNPSLIRVLLLCACGLLPACTFKFAYNNMEWMLPIFTRSYLKLDTDQKDKLVHAIELHRSWHRDTQLPLYIDLIQRIQKDIDTGLTKVQLHQHNTDIERFTETLGKQVTPDISQIIASSSDEQLQRFFQKLNKSYLSEKKAFEKYSAKERRDNNTEEFKAYLNEWLGKLTESQETAVKQWEKTYDMIDENILSQTQQWQRAFTNILRQPPELRNTPAAHTSLTQLILNPDQFNEPDYQQKLNHNRAITEDLIVVLANSLTAKQLKKVHKKINTFKNDLLDLGNAS